MKEIPKKEKERLEKELKEYSEFKHA